MLSRFAVYFDEAARHRSIRRASEHLRIAPSAIDRQILKMEDQLGVPLFLRLPQGLQLTAAGEMMVATIRRWRRELRTLEAQIDEMQGLRRGEVSLALAEGSGDLAIRSLHMFRTRYPGIHCRMIVAASQDIVDLVLRGEVEIGLTFNPPDRRELRVERAMVYQIGAVMLPDHPLAGCASTTLATCAEHPLVGPDEGHSLRQVLNRAWGHNIGTSPRFVATANSVTLIRAMVLGGIGMGLLTPIDVATELEQGLLRFVPLVGSNIPLSVLSLLTASGRPLSPPAALLIRHFAAAPVEDARIIAA
jgi:DNA-binding transcriptional LysR family regulator